MNVREMVIQLLSCDGCGVLPKADIEEAFSLIEIGFDSLRFMEFVILAEESLGIQFPDELLDLHSETTVERIVNSLSDLFQNMQLSTN